MKKQFEHQEERIDGKFKDMNTTMEKNKESIMNAIKSKNSVVQAQMDQLVKHVLVLNSSMKKQQGEVDPLQKRQEDKVEQIEVAKRARCRSNEDEFKGYMDELEDLVHDTQKRQGTPLDRGSPAAMAKS
eukprot:1303199-Ditylum_brightwellii.AAC.1